MEDKDLHDENKEELAEEQGQPQVSEAGKGSFLASDSYATKFVKRTLIDAVDKRASDIFIEPSEDNLRIRYRIDGLLCEAGTCPLKHTSSIVSCFKVVAGLDIAEHRMPQDGRFRMSISSKPVDFRVSVMPTNIGEKVVLRVLDKSRIKLDLDNLSFDKESLEILRRNLKKPYGMILVCGPTGCGKTTTLYASVNCIDSPEVNIITVEDPIEFQIQGINQVAVQDDIGLSFASVLRSALRQDPDIIMVGEIRDFETADIAVKASLTGHLVLSTIHTTTATGAIIRFINMGIEPFLMASSCLMTAAQALLRKLCQNCYEEIPSPKGLLETFKENKISVPSNFKYYKPVGCRFCNNVGYLGRIGIIEILELNPEIREMLIRNETELKIREYAVGNGMKTLRQKALGQVAQGFTTIEEVYRVTLE
jgi:type IV pilus assembly protein PilB